MAIAALLRGLTDVYYELRQIVHRTGGHLGHTLRPRPGNRGQWGRLILLYLAFHVPEVRKSSVGLLLRLAKTIPSNGMFQARATLLRFPRAARLA